MSIEEEIERTKIKLENEQRAERIKKQKEAEMKNALQLAGMYEYSPAVIVPQANLMPIINETLPSMRFDSPKVVRKFPDGVTRARIAVRSSDKYETGDEKSFDACIYSQGSGKDAVSYHIWVFKNGSIAIVQNNNANLTLNDLMSKGYDIAKIRAKIIEALAQQEIEHPRRTVTASQTANKSQNSHKSQGCYIATAVYGSYNCPEVWTLRRYRDEVLAKTLGGKAFISCYYAISPKLVKWFGNNKTFIRLWKNFLDNKVDKLNKNGVSNKEYHDK